jgi:hypothetical protein
MESEQLTNQRLDGGVLIFTHQASDLRRKIGIFEYAIDQIFVEDSPGLFVFGEARVEFFRQQVSYGFGSRAGLTGDGDEWWLGGAG